MFIMLLVLSHLTFGAEIDKKKEWFGELNKDYVPLYFTELKCKKKETGIDHQESKDLRCEIFRIKIL
jgi:hypothetical protein